MRISILGCGWFGQALAKSLINNGNQVNGSVTTDEKFDQLRYMGISPYLVKLGEEGFKPEPGFFSCDILVISIPPRSRSGQGESYLLKLGAIVNSLVQYGIKKVIYISSTGVYGEHNRRVTELDEPLPDSASGQILLDAERLFSKQTEFKTTIIRFGGLIGPGRHPGRFFAGRTEIPNGRAPVNMIHQSDAVGITETFIANDLFGYTVNACAPDHPEKSAFYPFMASRGGYPLPQFIDELQQWKLVGSVYLKPLLNSQFKIAAWNQYPPGTV